MKMWIENKEYRMIDQPSKTRLMPDTVEVLGYTLGTSEGWGGDGIEYLIFPNYIPAQEIQSWPKGATTLNINLVNGEVKAYDDQRSLAKFSWRDFIKNL